MTTIAACPRCQTPLYHNPQTDETSCLLCGHYESWGSYRGQMRQSTLSQTLGYVGGNASPAQPERALHIGTSVGKARSGARRFWETTIEYRQAGWQTRKRETYTAPIMVVWTEYQLAGSGRRCALVVEIRTDAPLRDSTVQQKVYEMRDEFKKKTGLRLRLTRHVEIKRLSA